MLKLMGSGRGLIVVLSVLFGLMAVPAAAGAATIDAEFGPTLTGAAPWDATAGPGNDTTESDGIVRTNDEVTYTWSISVNDGASPNTTITQTLPDGMVWETPLPAFCLSTGTPVSSISPDGRTIVCNIGDKDSSTGSADQYPVVARVEGDVANGTEFDSSFSVTSSDPGTPDAGPIDGDTVTVSAAPRVNLVKSSPLPPTGVGYESGVWGHYVTYPVSLVVDSENGKGTKGNELIVTPIQFDDAFTTSPAGVAFELVGCNKNSSQISGIPNGAGGSNSSVTESGTPTCAQVAPGDDISFEVPGGADLTGEHVPVNNSNGSPVAANRAYLATYYIRIFIPDADVVAAGGTVNIDNEYENFDADSISGQPNVEPTEDNVQNVVLNAQDPSPGTVNINKWFNPSGNEGYQIWNQNQVLYPDTTFWGMVRLSSGGHLPIPAGTVAICDMFDNTTYNLTLDGTVGSDPDQPAWVTGHASGTGANAVVEYGTGGVRGNDTAGWTATRGDDCADGSSPSGWSTDPSTVPGGLDAITKVRVRYLVEIPAGTSNVSTLHLNVKARNNDLADDSLLPTGTILGNFAKISRNQDQGAPTWSGNSYNPENASGSIGWRVKLTRGQVRINKNTDPEDQAVALSGDQVTYRLKVTATGEQIPGGIMPDVVVTDTLSEYLTYQPGSATPAPTDVIENGDGTTTLVWELGDRPINDPIPDITYQARIKLTTPNNLDAVNVAVVSSPEDASPENQRRDQHQIRVTMKAGILIEKRTTTPWIEPHDQLEYQIEYVNNSVTGLSELRSIDVLPYNGDGRGSDFNGTISLDSVEVFDGEDVYYTSRAPEQIDTVPTNPSNMPGGATTWCLEADLGSAGCPADIGASTAILVDHTDPVPRFESNTYEVTLNTDGNLSGDLYGNNASLGTTDPAVSLTAHSPIVNNHVVASALGDYVWLDSNRNGIQDPGEPPMAGITVNLVGTDKHGHAVEETTTTDPDGRYLFANLVSGDYEITFVKPDGYEFTIRGAGDAGTDSNADPATGRTGQITIDSPIPLQADQEDLTWDAGLIAQPSSITVIKDARPNADVNFRFDTTGGLTPSGFVLNDDGRGDEDRTVFDGLEAGTYGISERERNGWSFVSLECTGPATTTIDGASASIDLAPGQDVTCTYVNRRDPKPNVALRKRADRKKVRAGRVVTYRIQFRNTVRNTVARNVLICDDIPRRTSVVNRGGGFFRNGKVCWRVNRLAFSRGFKQRSLKLRVDRDAKPGSKIVNKATAPGARAKATVRVTRPAGGNAARGGGVTG